MKILVLLFLFGFSFSFGQTERGNIDLPKLILSEYDTILSTSVTSMQPSTASVYGIGIIDTLKLTEGRFIYDEESVCAGEIRQENVLTLIVNAFDPDFHSHHLSGLEKLPPPPPIGLNILDSVYIDSVGGYDYMLNQTGDSLIRDAKLVIEKKERIHYTSYPFFLYNFSNDDITVSNPINRDLYVILEAMDKSGEWKPIEYWEQYRFLCGTGHSDYKLPPKTFLVGAFKRYSGDFYAKLRLKLSTYGRIIYSNVFEDYINYNQFDRKEVTDNIRTMFSNRDDAYIEKRIAASFLE